MPAPSERDPPPGGPGDPAEPHVPARRRPARSERYAPLSRPGERRRRGARRRLVVREHDALPGLTEEEQRELRDFALARTDREGLRRPVLALRNGRLHAQNRVGVIETRGGTVIEILPKIDLAPAGTTRGRPASGRTPPPGEEATRQVFLTMLRDWRGLGEARLDLAGIRALRQFDMLEAFVQHFLDSVVQLVRRGLARQYRTREANLPCLRGRILFPRHVRENLVDRSRFYVGYDEFTADRPANRLIHHALRQLAGIVRHPANRQRIHQLRIVFSVVPPSKRPGDDWARHRVDRSMRHYDAVMPWVGLLLFRKGLATFAGRHINRALLFPMEEVFEDFVTAAVRRHQRRFAVRSQGPMRPLATDGAGRDAFRLKPDVTLLESGRTERRHVRFVLDAKWKRLDPASANHGVAPADAYQMFAYGKRYGCRHVALLYPRTAAFRNPLRYRFVEDALALSCFPFDVADPEGSVRALLDGLLPRPA